jgi:catalase-peroxidase
MGVDTVTSGLEGAWTSTPIQWSHEYFNNLFNYEWELTKSPAGAHQWVPKGINPLVPDAHDPSKKHLPVMLTTDLSLIKDPEYRKISKRFLDNPGEFNLAFAKAWYKLTHRDLGPHSRLLGSEVPQPQLWQDPVPAVDHKLIGEKEIAALKGKILASGLTVPQLVSTAWASASTYRDTDMRGGANGARIRLAPQKDWKANQPAELAKALETLEKVRAEFNKAQPGGMKVSLADLIVLGGVAAVEKAAKDAGVEVKVPFKPGRTDATAEMSDAASFDVLEPKADGFRNYLGEQQKRSPAALLVDRAALLTLTAPEMAVLVGGLRVLNANYGGSKDGVFTEKPGALTNDFFVNLLDMGVEWKKVGDQFEAVDRKTGKAKWTGTEVDLVFGHNEQLRAIAEVYAADDAKEKFAKDFAAAWHKVMSLGRFDS